MSLKFNILRTPSKKELEAKQREMDEIKRLEAEALLNQKPIEPEKPKQEDKKLMVDDFIAKVNEGKTKKKALIEELETIIKMFYNDIDEDNLNI